MQIDLFGKPIIQEQIEEVKIKKISPFEYVKSIQKKGKKIDPRDYNPFIINLALSQDKTDVIYANEMNRYIDIPAVAQYAFYYYGTPKNTKFNKWAKTTKIDSIKAVKIYHKVSEAKAKEYIRILTQEQLDQIQEYINTNNK